MTPAARVAAAIGILDDILAGTAANKVLTGWGRRNRYAGSGDRAAIRDHVFQALRCRRSYGFLGGADTGRGVMVGWARTLESDHMALFSGEKYAPEPLNEPEMEPRDLGSEPRGVRLDCPDWLLDRFDAALGQDADRVLGIFQSRAPVFLRVNLAKAEVAAAQSELAESGIATRLHALADTALEITENPRRVAQSPAFLQGLVELQDVASQAVVNLLPLADGNNVLDYCAGGGGKSLAMAARAGLAITAHDADPARMRDIPTRAVRAGANVQFATTDELQGQTFDLVLCDAPCSGSGSWRRAPDAKWALTQDRLSELVEIQTEILRKASTFVSESGTLAYVTCSFFADENAEQIDKFLDTFPGWELSSQRQLTPLDGGDGFYIALLKRVLSN